MNGTLIQIIGSGGLEELYWFNSEHPDLEEIKNFYREYLIKEVVNDFENSFEDWMSTEHPETELERVYTEEIII